MADKGFDLKVLIPTDDGFKLSSQGIEKCKYYLMYNISNRSYQLASKKKFADLFETNFNVQQFIEYLNAEKVDLVLTTIENNYHFSFEKVDVQEINQVLNYYIDLIDKKSANKD